MSSLQVQLDQFEGPMGLLLYLVRREQMDILDINIHDITSQYLDTIKKMKSLDLEVAGEFIAMAATLIQIKSQMLLPMPELDELDEGPDPRKNLIRKLKEYEIYKEASEAMYERPLLGRDVWTRGGKLPKPKTPDSDIQVPDPALFHLIGSYRFILKQAEKAIHVVGERLQSVASRILEIKSFLKIGERVGFFKIVKVKAVEQEDTKSALLITFLSLLELGKMGIVRLFQADTFSDIHIETQKSIESDVISRVEEFDKVEEFDFDNIEVEQPAKDNEEADPELLASDEEIEAEEALLDL